MVQSGSFTQSVRLEDTPGFELQVTTNQPPCRFFFMGGKIVHEADGLLKIIGTEMKIQLDRVFNPAVFQIMSPLEQNPVAKDYVSLLAVNFSHILTSVQQEAKKESERRYQQLQKTFQEVLERLDTELESSRSIRRLLLLEETQSLSLAIRSLKEERDQAVERYQALRNQLSLLARDLPTLDMEGPCDLEV